MLVNARMPEAPCNANLNAGITRQCLMILRERERWTIAKQERKLVTHTHTHTLSLSLEAMPAKRARKIQESEDVETIWSFDTSADPDQRRLGPVHISKVTTTYHAYSER